MQLKLLVLSACHSERLLLGPGSRHIDIGIPHIVVVKSEVRFVRILACWPDVLCCACTANQAVKVNLQRNPVAPVSYIHLAYVTVKCP